MRSLSRWCATVIVVAALAYGHWWYHYSPRLRPAAPTGPEASLLEVPWAETAAWVPFPHQNLRALEKLSGLPADAALDVLVLAGVKAPRLPAFGGMLSPPARSLTLATGAEGQLAVAVRVYPAFAAFARLAGRLANNPWLLGGEVSWGDRLVQVEWHGTLWLAGLPGLPALGKEPEPQAELSLLVATARRPSPPLPTGKYRLRLEDDALHLSSYRPGRRAAPLDLERDARDANLLDAAGVLLLVVAGAEPGLVESPDAQAMMIFGQDPDDIAELPRASIVHGGGERWSLPAEGLLELTGRTPPISQHGRWAVVATDPAGLEATDSLLEILRGRLSSSEAGALDLDLWLRLGPAAVEMTRLRRGLERAPWLPRQKLRRWQAAERLLSGLALKHASLRVEVTPAHGLALRVTRRENIDANGRYKAEEPSAVD